MTEQREPYQTDRRACFNCEGWMQRTTKPAAGWYCAGCDTFEPDNQTIASLAESLTNQAISELYKPDETIAKLSRRRVENVLRHYFIGALTIGGKKHD